MSTYPQMFEEAERFLSRGISANAKIVGAMVEDDSTVYETESFFVSSNFRRLKGNEYLGLFLRKRLWGRKLETAHIRELITEGHTPIISGFRSDITGKPFDAMLILKKDGRLTYKVFDPEEQYA